MTFKCACCKLLSLPTLFTQIGQERRCDSICIHCMHRRHQLCCALNKDTGSNDDDWLKYPIIYLMQFYNLFHHSLFSGGHVSAILENPNVEWLPAILNTCLDNDAENQSLLCTEIMRRGLAWITVTLCIRVKHSR